MIPVELWHWLPVLLYSQCVSSIIWHQCVCSLWSSNSFYVTHHESLLVLLLLSLLSHLSRFIHLFLMTFPLSMHYPPFFHPSSSMRRQSWSSTWSRNRSSRLTSSWKRSRRWRMKPFQSSLPWNRYDLWWWSKKIPASCVEQHIPELVCPVFVLVWDAKLSPSLILLSMFAGKNILVCGWVKPVCAQPLHNVSMLWWQDFSVNVHACIHCCRSLSECICVRVMLVLCRCAFCPDRSVTKWFVYQKSDEQLVLALAKEIFVDQPALSFFYYCGSLTRDCSSIKEKLIWSKTLGL